MSKEKIISGHIFANADYFVIILQIFFATRMVLKIGEMLGYSPRDLFGQVTHERKNLMDYNN